MDAIPGIRKIAFPEVFAPMLASPAERSFSGAAWIFEPKLDGIRCVAMVKGGKCRLFSRRGLEITYQYPGLAEELESTCAHDVVLDGEIIALNEQGTPSFQHLQQRMNLTKRADIARAEINVPAFYFIFDMMQFDEYSLTGLGLSERRKLMQSHVNQSTRVRLISQFEHDGQVAYEACVESGFEGVVAKRQDSRYESGRRSPSWLKVKAQQTSEFVIGGYTAGQGSRGSLFGALLLGYYDEQQRFIYSGSVGTGFDDTLLREVMKRIRPLIIEKCPFLKRPDEKKEVTWTTPMLVAEIKFMDWTRDGHLRTPVFLRFRDDKEPLSVGRESFVRPFLAPTNSVIRGQAVSEVSTSNYQTAAVIESTPTLAATALRIEVPDRLPVVVASSDASAEIVRSVVSQLQSHTSNFMLHVGADKFQITSPDKILWGKHDDSPPITKRDYLIYLATVSPTILPHLHARPLTIIRSPWGVRGKPFYQKHWHSAIPEFFETTVVPHPDEEDNRREHLLCNNLSTLLFLGQNGILEYHVMPSRMERDWDLLAPPEDFQQNNESSLCDTTAGWLLNYPEYLIFDLDMHKESAKQAKYTPRESNKGDFEKMCEVACILRAALMQIGVDPLVKLSGKGGLHIVVPIIRNLDFDHARVLSETIARFAASLSPAAITMETSIDKRQGKIFLDYGSNMAGKTMIGAYSPRITEDATVSLPVTWPEIEAGGWIPCTLNDTLDRLKQNPDLWKDILTKKFDLRARISSPGHS